MLMSVLIALVAGVAAFALGTRNLRARSERADWLVGALRALSRADEPRGLASALAHHLESGIGASHVEWWQRGHDGTYSSRLGRIADADANVLDLWIAEGRTWHCDVPAA